MRDMSRDTVTTLRRRVATGTPSMGTWKRALAGLVLLALLMAVVSFLSGRMKGGGSAAQALDKADESHFVAAGEKEVDADGEGDMNAPVERDPVSEEAEIQAQADDAALDTKGSTPVGKGSSTKPDVYRETPSLDLGGSLFRVFLGLAAVVVLILVVKRLAGRKAARRRSYTHGRLEVVGYTPLGPASGIYEVKAGDRILMIGEAEKGLALLGEVDLESFVRADDAEILEDEFLALLREEMEPRTRPEPLSVRRPLLEELKWKTARKRGRTRG